MRIDINQSHIGARVRGDLARRDGPAGATIDLWHMCWIERFAERADLDLRWDRIAPNDRLMAMDAAVAVKCRMINDNVFVYGARSRSSAQRGINRISLNTC